MNRATIAARPTTPARGSLTELLSRRGPLPREDRIWLARLLLDELEELSGDRDPRWHARATAMIHGLTTPVGGLLEITAAGRSAFRAILKRQGRAA